jgi:hypothetical protein
MNKERFKRLIDLLKFEINDKVKELGSIEYHPKKEEFDALIYYEWKSYIVTLGFILKEDSFDFKPSVTTNPSKLEKPEEVDLEKEDLSEFYINLEQFKKIIKDEIKKWKIEDHYDEYE